MSKDSTITINTLDSRQAARYEALTFPYFRPLLHGQPQMQLQERDQNLKTVVAVGAEASAQPIGLALASYSTTANAAEIHSIFITPTARSKGIGTALLAQIEQELWERGCRGIKLSYATSKSTTAALERILHKCSWPTPKPRTLMCWMDGRILDAPWMRRYRTHQSSVMIPWRDLAARELSILRNKIDTDARYADHISPFFDEAIIEPMNSVWLQYQGEIAGWMITHRTAPDTIRYSSAWVIPALRSKGYGVKLLIHALQHQDWQAIPKGIAIVWHNNDLIVPLLKHKGGPYFASMRETKGTCKRLVR